MGVSQNRCTLFGKDHMNTWRLLGDYQGTFRLRMTDYVEDLLEAAVWQFSDTANAASSLLASHEPETSACA